MIVRAVTRRTKPGDGRLHRATRRLAVDLFRPDPWRRECQQDGRGEHDSAHVFSLPRGPSRGPNFWFDNWASPGTRRQSRGNLTENGPASATAARAEPCGVSAVNLSRTRLKELLRRQLSAYSRNTGRQAPRCIRARDAGVGTSLPTAMTAQF